MWTVKSVSSIVPANRGDASGLEGEECGSQFQLWRETFRDRINSSRCDNET
jgi:hypothetical protein